jgi:cytochrome c556
MRIATSALGALAIAAAGAPSFAQEQATGFVRERIEMMQLMASRMKTIRERIDGKRDLAAIKPDAEDIVLQSGHLLHLFPHSSMQRPTDAKATIWKDWTDFELRSAALETESKKLVDASPNDVGKLGAQLRALSQVCLGCHEKFRGKKSRKGDLW